MHRVQEQKLVHHEEQEEYDGQASAKQILQALQETYTAQGDKGVGFFKARPVALTARASDSKSEGWGFESLLACHLNSAEELKAKALKWRTN